jgi:hypothetical protein
MFLLRKLFSSAVFAFYRFKRRYKGAFPLIILNHSGVTAPFTSFLKSVVGNPNAFKYYGPPMDTFRGDRREGGL